MDSLAELLTSDPTGPLTPGDAALFIRLREAVRVLQGEVVRLDKQSESWRVACLAWQTWGEKMRTLVRCTLNGDEPTRAAIANQLESWREQRDHAQARAVKAEAEVARLTGKAERERR